MFLLIDDLVMFLNEIFKSLPTVLGVREEVLTLPTTTPAPIAQVRNSKIFLKSVQWGVQVFYIIISMYITSCLLFCCLQSWLNGLVL